MHWFDVGVGIALLIGSVWSFFRGLTREVLSILGMIAAFALAGHGYPYAAAFFKTFVRQLWLRQAIGFGLIFVATVVLYVLFAKLVHRLIRAAGLSVPDRILGGLFGMIKVGVMIAVLLLVTTQFFPHLSRQLATRSLLAPTFFHVANLLATLLPEGASDEFHRAYDRLHRQLPIWVPTPTPHSVSPGPPTTVFPQSQSVGPDGISENDARALEEILQKRLQEP